MSIPRFHAIALLLLAPVSFAASFDIASYDPPAGFKEERSGDHIGYTRTDGSSGTFCQIALYSSRTANDTLENEFRTDWQQVAVRETTDDIPPAERGASAKGIAWVAGEQDVAVAGMHYRSRLYTLQADKAVLTLAVNASNPAVLRSCRGAADAIIASLALPRAPERPAAPSAPSAAAGQGGLGGGKIAGVWMSFKSDYLATRSYEPRPAWMVFFDDGMAYRDLPREGLLAFDRVAARAGHPQNVARWSYSNGSGRVHLGGDPKFDIRLAEGKKAGELLLDDTVYYRQANVDGSRFSGEWTSFSNPEDPLLDQLKPGERPVIRFTREGRFSDDGLFTTLLKSYSDPAENFIGSGTYAIKDYTLMLRYDDGRERRIAFSGFLGVNPATDDNKFIFVGRAMLTKRK